jgi:predicted nucleotidyltransferase
MSSVLRELAEEVDVSERTLRRGVSSELIRARRPSSRRLLLSEPEIEWVRSHWRLVSELRAALRTEPNVELAVLFGSVARGDDVTGISDVDLLVGLRRPAPGALQVLRARLGARLSTKVQLVPLEAARRNPRLLAELVRDGRPLVDRERSWQRLQAQAGRAGVQADQLGDDLHESARAALSYFRELAAARARSPVGAA